MSTITQARCSHCGGDGADYHKADCSALLAQSAPPISQISADEIRKEPDGALLCMAMDLSARDRAYQNIIIRKFGLDVWREVSREVTDEALKQWSALEAAELERRRRSAA